MQRLQIDAEFKELIPPLKPEEYEQLEKNILEEGIRDAIVTWDSIILDGHNRYKIAQEHDLPFVEMPMNFANRNEAKDWMIDNQLGRRNLTTEQWGYLLGLRYKGEKLSHGGDRASAQSVHLKTAEKLGELHGVSRMTVQRAEKFADGIDNISKVRPELKQEILQGRSDFTKQEVQSYSDAEIEAEVERRLEERELEKKNRYAQVAERIRQRPEQIQSKVNEQLVEMLNVEYGDVYLINNRHKLIVYDAYQADVIKQVAGNNFDLVLTDPPYGISYKSPTGSAFTARGDYKIIEGDEEEFDPFILFEYGDNVITWGANHYANRLDNSAGWLVWDKREGVAINNNSDCELAWTNMLGSARLFHHKWNGMIKASEQGDKRIHPTQKPVKLFEWCLDITEAGDKVLDIFAGSGSVLLACESTDRTATLVENDTEFASAALHRFSNAGLEVVKVGNIIQERLSTQ